MAIENESNQMVLFLNLSYLLLRNPGRNVGRFLFLQRLVETKPLLRSKAIADV
ncbi:hypothetical protein AXF42_Ash007389 [Apostasia shenzhenica]|uniref:Uncharacterized protein n=1 Tax=Apostasia shenzhenica TaxID=1088818 RepID=A0A2I0BA15_9ASPA|nr:hypothetical protein AXF42_Ash007389 [Apostasia shenzhenica]